MTDALEPTKLAVKDALVLVPLYMSALAISWEIGSFIPIGAGAFSLFTLTEHLTFASGALPLAALLAFSTLLFWVSGPMMVSIYIARLKRWPRLARADVLLRLAGVVLGLYMVGAGSYLGLVSFLVLGLAIALVFSATFLPKITHPPKFLAAVGLLSFSLLLALIFGLDETRMQLNSKANLGSATIQLTENTLEGVFLIRSGDRGILTYDPALQAFAFIKWDAVKRLDWARRGLRDTLGKAVQEKLLWRP